MESSRAVHLPADVLKAFGLGQLDDLSAEVVMNHLNVCADCCKAVASQSGDDFLKRLRQVHGRNSTPSPAQTLAPSVASVAQLPGRPTTLHNLPPELAEHPQYEILRELGKGGMGIVYLAKNKLMDRLEVLKVVNQALLDRPGSVERFLREIRSAAKFGHANVVGAYSALQLGDVLAFAMEYVEGEDLAVLVKANGPLPVNIGRAGSGCDLLAVLVKANGPLPVAHACYYIQQAALGLQHAFEKNMVHRDIKPQNLILAREGKKHVIKILDFGLAKVTREKVEDTGLTGEGKMLGTPDYIAPEQTLDAASADIRADIYSLGCTLYYLLTGAPPFKGKSLYEVLQAHHSLEARLLNLARPEVPEELAAVVRKMMAKEAARRYQTPAEVARALAAFIKPGAKGGTPPKSSSDLSVGEPEAKAERFVAPAAANVRREAATTQVPPVAGWETLTEGSSASAESRKSGAIRKRRPPGVQSGARKKWLIGGVGVSVLLLALLGMWASGVFKVKTANGTIVLENVPADAEVVVDGATVTLRDRGGEAIEIRVAAGKKHQLQVKKKGFKVFSEEVEIDAGGSRAILVRLQPKSTTVESSQPLDPPPPVKPKAEDVPPPMQPKPEDPPSTLPVPAAVIVATEAERALKLKTDDAVAAGLQWLARQQMGDGRWRLGTGPTPNDVAATAFALLPLLEAGNTPKSSDALHPYARAVERGLKFLVKGQGANGAFALDMYAHALATRAVCEAYRRTKDLALKARAQRAINFIVKAQHEKGGWRYTPRSPGDTSVTSYMVLALASARRAGLNVPKETLIRTGKYLDSAASADGSAYGYVPGSVTSMTMSAAGHLCRLELGGKTDDKGLVQWAASVRQLAPLEDKINLYCCHYVTLTFQRRGGADWNLWESRVRKVLLANQDQGQENAAQQGSWPSDGPFRSQGGQLMTTSLALLTLQACAWADKLPP